MKEIQAIVRRELDNLIDAGYTDILSLTTREIAAELIQNHADVQDCTVDELIPHIQAWYACV